MTHRSTLSSATGSPVIARIRSQVPEFEGTFQRELDAEGPAMGAFQAMSMFAAWLADRIEASPEDADAHGAFRVVEDIASSDYPMGRELIAEFVEALRDNPRAVTLIGPETLRWTD